MSEERPETMDHEMTEQEECSSRGRLSDLPDSCGELSNLTKVRLSSWLLYVKDAMDRISTSLFTTYEDHVDSTETLKSALLGKCYDL